MEEISTKRSPSTAEWPKMVERGEDTGSWHTEVVLVCIGIKLVTTVKNTQVEILILL